jgi:ABC-2 type transport system ATP-binding protein
MKDGETRVSNASPDGIDHQAFMEQYVGTEVAVDFPRMTALNVLHQRSTVSQGAYLTSSSPVVLRMERCTKRFGDVLAVNDLSLEVRAGEVLGFLGPNGSGKSTTIGMVLGLIRPTSGTISICGGDAIADPSLVRHHVGAIIENPAFYPYMSGRDNLRAYAYAVGNVPDSRIDELLSLVNLTERARHQFKTYSLGMKQRLGVASTLLTRPPLIILDEPTNGLDPAGQREIREIIPRLAEEGAAVLLASHMLHEVEQVSDRVLIVRRGRLVTEGNVDDLLRRGGYLEVAVPRDDLAAALKIVRRLPIVEQVTIEGERLIVVAPDDAGSALNHALVDEGIFASEIVARHSSLEDIFLELTGEANA